MNDFVDNIIDYSNNWKKVLLYTFLFSLFCFFAYLTVHFGYLIRTVPFFLTKLSFFLVCLVAAILALCLLLPTCYAIGIYVIFLIKFIKLLFEWLHELPERLQHEFDIWKRIWANRGFGKYTLFGGLTFYLKLRLRILAFFLLGMSIFLLAYGFHTRYTNYKRQYWREKVFYGQSLQEIYTLLPNTPYTIKTSLMIFYMKIENSKQMVYFPIDKNLYLQHMIDIPNEWNITFTDTTQLSFGVYYYTSPDLTEIFETSDFEIWENVRNGRTLDTTYFRKFTPLEVYQKNLPLTFPPGHWDE